MGVSVCHGCGRYSDYTRILIVCMSYATAFPEWEGRSIVGVELPVECLESTLLLMYLIQSGYSRRNRIVTDSRFWCRTKGVCFVVISHFSLLSVPVSASVTVFHGIGTPYSSLEIHEGSCFESAVRVVVNSRSSFIIVIVVVVVVILLHIIRLSAR